MKYLMLLIGILPISCPAQWLYPMTDIVVPVYGGGNAGVPYTATSIVFVMVPEKRFLVPSTRPPLELYCTGIGTMSEISNVVSVRLPLSVDGESMTGAFSCVDFKFTVGVDSVLPYDLKGSEYHPGAKLTIVLGI